MANPFMRSDASARAAARSKNGLPLHDPPGKLPGSCTAICPVLNTRHDHFDRAVLEINRDTDARMPKHVEESVGAEPICPIVHEVADARLADLKPPGRLHLRQLASRHHASKTCHQERSYAIALGPRCCNDRADGT
jgi:hypothetical protein